MSTDPKLTAEEERMLDLALGRGALPDAGSECGAEAASLRLFVAQTRAELGQLDVVVPARLSIAQAALSDACEDNLVASTSPGLFGDFALGFDFFKKRLKRNAALRIAAASLLIHLTALPVLAWFAFVKPEPSFINIHIEKPPVVLTEEPDAEVLEPLNLLDEASAELLDAELEGMEKSEDMLESSD
jgi:hypothetical protein